NGRIGEVGVGDGIANCVDSLGIEHTLLQNIGGQRYPSSDRPVSSPRINQTVGKVAVRAATISDKIRIAVDLVRNIEVRGNPAAIRKNCERPGSNRAGPQEILGVSRGYAQFRTHGKPAVF